MASAKTQNIHIAPSSLLLDSSSKEKRFYQYNKFSTNIVTDTLTIYEELFLYI